MTKNYSKIFNNLSDLKQNLGKHWTGTYIYIYFMLYLFHTPFLAILYTHYFINY